MLLVPQNTSLMNIKLLGGEDTEEKKKKESDEKTQKRKMFKNEPYRDRSTKRNRL